MIAKKIKCPRCGLFTLYSTDNPNRPFCSARCQLVDLGKWADESYRVPINTDPDSLNSEDFMTVEEHSDSEES